MLLSTRNQAKGQPIMATKTQAPKTAEQVKTELRAKGMTLAQWAQQNGYDRDTVYKVIGGTRKGWFGKGHEIAVKLGLKQAA